MPFLLRHARTKLGIGPPPLSVDEARLVRDQSFWVCGAPSGQSARRLACRMKQSPSVDSTPTNLSGDWPQKQKTRASGARMLSLKLLDPGSSPHPFQASLSVPNMQHLLPVAGRNVQFHGHPPGDPAFAASRKNADVLLKKQPCFAASARPSLPDEFMRVECCKSPCPSGPRAAFRIEPRRPSRGRRG